jgi:hypothetical protein
MNTYTNALHPKKEGQRTARNNMFQNTAIVTILLVLITTVAIAAYIASRPAVAAENDLVAPYSNALEMQYARPWLEPQNKPVAAYGNALELQYARPWLEPQKKPVAAYGNALELQYMQPWLDAPNKPVVKYSNALEMQYAQPWLEAENKSAVSYSNALELQYARPWLDKAVIGIAVTGNAQALNCSSSMEMLYACKFGFGIP